MIKSKKAALISIFSFLLLFTIKAHCKEPHYTNGFRYNDPAHHEKAIAKLRKNNIPIIVSDDGHATYQDKYKQKVTQILKRLDNRPYSEYYKRQYSDNFTALLDENMIEYEVKFFNDKKIQVYWNYEDDELVRKLKDENLNRIFER